MTSHTNLTLVTGGTGKTGRRVADRLRDLGHPVRIGSRRGEPPFDWNDSDTWADALRDVDAVYVAYYPDLAFPGAAETVGAFADAAVAAAASLLVLLSGRGEEGALAGEQAIRDAGAGWTIVRASWFMQNFSEHFLLDPVRDGVIALPAGGVAEPFIDVDDVADIAAAALTDPRHAGRLYEVTGPRLLTFADIAAELGRVTGREIHYLSVTADEYAAGAAASGVPAEEVAGLTDLFTRVLDGRNAQVTDGVQQALGRPARDFADYAASTAATGVWAAPDRVR